MNLSKIKLKKPYDEYTVSFKKAIESETGHKIEDISTAFQAAKYSPAEVAEHIGCTVDVIYTNCKKAKIKLAAKRHLPKPVDVAPKNLSVDYLYKKW